MIQTYDLQGLVLENRYFILQLKDQLLYFKEASFKQPIQYVSYNQMTYFQNAFFMATIIKNQGAADLFLNTQVVPLLIYQQMETRLVLETAIKFMKKDSRSKLCASDIQLAARQIGHSQMCLINLPASRGIKNGKIHISNLLDSCAFRLSSRLETSQLKGRWIFYNDNIVEKGRRHSIKRLKREDGSSLQKMKAQEFNIISITGRQPKLTKEEFAYLSTLENELIKNERGFDGKIQGRVGRHFHLYLELIRRHPNEAGIRMLLNLFNFKDQEITQNTILCNLPKLFEVLMVYRGAWAYHVGEMIVELVSKYKLWQPQLLKIFQVVKQDFSHVIKAIVFETEMGIEAVKNNLHTLIRKLYIHSEWGNEISAECLRLLLQRADKIAAFQKQKVQLPLQLCLSYLKADNYLSCY